MIHLDLARVGTGRGVATPEPVDRARAVEWIVGGGIAGIEEIRALGRAGFDGVLVGSALHDGRIGRGSETRSSGSISLSESIRDLDRPGDISAAVGPVDDPGLAVLVVDVIDERVDVGRVAEVRLGERPAAGRRGRRG